MQSWRKLKREPLFHISSPKLCWQGKPKSHADFIDIDDFPEEWLRIDATVDVEAKAKELAVLKLQTELGLPPWRETDSEFEARRHQTKTLRR